MADGKVSTKLLLKSSFWYTASSFLTRAMAFITVPIYTRLMSKAEYGDFSVYASWQQILVIICGFEVYATLNRARFDFQRKEELDGYISSCLVLTTIITGVFFALYFLFPGVSESWFLIKRKYMMVMFAYLFTFPAFSMFMLKQRIEYKYKLSAAISFTVTIVSSIFALLLVLSFKSDKLFGRIIGQYCLSIIVGFAFYLFFLHNSTSIKTAYFKYAFRIGIPLIFSYLASRILLTSDIIVLKHMCTAEEVSCLSVSHSASQTIMLLVQALNMAWSPWFYDMLKLKEYHHIRKVYTIYLWLSISITLCILLIGPEFITVLGGNKYKESVYLLPPYILSGTFTVLTSQFGYLETYHKKPEYAAALTGIVAVLNVILDIIGVRLFGYRAVCYATVICQILLIVLHYIVAKRMDIEKFLPVRTLTAVLISSLLLIPAALLIYMNNMIRYGFIGMVAIAVAAIAIVKRGEIATILRKNKLIKAQRNEPVGG